MRKEDFAKFVESTIEEIILLAEEKCGRTLPRNYSFRWLGRSHQVVADNIVDHIVQRVFVDEEHIYPCVDIGVGDILKNGSLLFVEVQISWFAPMRRHLRQLANEYS
jgi:hypothetical protein